MRTATLAAVVITALFASIASAETLCIVTSQTGNNVSVDCSNTNPQIWPNDTRSYAFSSGSPSICLDGQFVCGFEPNGDTEEAAVGSNQYGWSISRSSTDPLDTVGPVAVGAVPLYLWMFCSEGDGVSAVEFALQGSASVLLLGVTPMNGWLNAGSGSQILMAVGGCPTGPVLAATVLVLNLNEPVSVESETWSDVKAMYR